MFKHMASKMFTLALAAAVLGSAPAMAQDEEEAAADSGSDKIWSVEIDNTFNSKYVWRGQLLTDDPVWQPSATGAVKIGNIGTLSVLIWGNMDLDDVNDNQGEFNEVDYDVNFSWSLDPFTFSHGTVLYDFPNTDFHSTWEIYNAIGLNVPLSPTLTWYQDMDEAEGAYISFGIGHDIDFGIDSEDITLGLSLAGSVAWADSDYNDFYFGVNDGSFNDVTASVGLPIGLGPYFSITPAVNYSYLLDSDIRDEVDDEDNFWAGVSVTFAY